MEFKGFPYQTIDFLRNLSQNNSAAWFHENQDAYKNYFVAPALEFITVLGAQLSQLTKELIYEAKMNRSLFRLNRDVRFSKNKAPYKNNMGILFWKGPFPVKHENPGFYFHMEPDMLLLATGTWMFTPPVQEEYRASLLDAKQGPRLAKIAEDLNAEHIALESDFKLKNPPKGFPKDHPMADFARFKGISCTYQEISGLPDVIHKPELVDFCMAWFRKTVPALEWMVDMTYRAANK